MSGQFGPGRACCKRQEGRDDGACDRTTAILPDGEQSRPFPGYSMSKGSPVTERPKLAVSGATMEPAMRNWSAVSISQ